MRPKPLLYLAFGLLITFFPEGRVNAQILFVQDCFNGGVFTSGLDNVGASFGNKTRIKWDPTFSVRAAYAVTYRYGRPEPHTMFVNGTPVHWSNLNQAGPEQVETNGFSLYFAPHVSPIENLSIQNDTLLIDFPIQSFYDFAWNWGWWGIYVIVLYESPGLDEDVCLNLYIADQSQVTAQNYILNKPSYDLSHELVFGFHSSRLSPAQSDATQLHVNNLFIGEMWGPDLIISDPAYAGVQGHFAYDEYNITGLNGDTANATVHSHDGTAILNSYINENDEWLQFKFIRSVPASDGGANPHPSFTLAYTPSCPVTSSDAMPRSYTLCRGDTLQLEGIEGFGHYAWIPDLQLSDSTAMNPVCIPDSSRWYRLRMWNDDPAQGCPLTIPVWVEVGDIPRPPNPVAVASSCPNPTGRVRLENPPGLAPFLYELGSSTSAQPVFDQVAPGSYAVSVSDARGCRWDSTLTVPLKPAQQAAFIANPLEGFSPLTVSMLNQSSGATSHYWMVDGETFSQAHATTYAFADTGTYALSVVAIRDVFSCADTATIFIRVGQGMQLTVPNIFTPNGDGFNDELVAKSLGARYLSWEVYNRWGNLMHRGEAQPQPLEESSVLLWSPTQALPQSGPGRSNRPEQAPADGSYILILNAENLAGEREQLQFVVQLKR